MGQLDNKIAVDVVKGLCIAAKENNTAVIGGETAEMPGLYQGEDYDLAGTIVGIVDKSRVINGSCIEKGDILIGLPSNGLHTNGYSLARKICFELMDFNVDTFIEELGCTIGEELLKIHRSYLDTINRLRNSVKIKGLSHITGGGIIGNTIRIIPKDTQLQINWSGWEPLPIFQLLKKWGELSDEEMRLTFNLGIGMIIIVDKSVQQYTMDNLKKMGEFPVKIGEII
jgi:phosphoribosylformylglycinamidine cyclo-ligase